MPTEDLKIASPFLVSVTDDAILEQCEDDSSPDLFMIVLGRGWQGWWWWWWGRSIVRYFCLLGHRILIMVNFWIQLSSTQRVSGRKVEKMRGRGTKMALISACQPKTFTPIPENTASLKMCFYTFCSRFVSW